MSAKTVIESVSVSDNDRPGLHHTELDVRSH